MKNDAGGISRRTGGSKDDEERLVYYTGSASTMTGAVRGKSTRSG